MRGRTNVTQRSGAAQVNGDVKSLTVKTGNTISIGDFVSVEYGPSSVYSPSGINFQTQNNQVFNITNDRLIMFYSNYADVVDTSNGIVFVAKFVGTWHSIDVDQTCAVCKISDNKFAIVYYLSYITSSGVKVDYVTFDFSNNTYTVETKKYVNSSATHISDYINGILYVNGKIIISCGSYSTSYYRNLFCLDVESNTVECMESIYKGSGRLSIINVGDNSFFLFGGSNEKKIAIGKYIVDTTISLQKSFTFTNGSWTYYSAYCCYLGNNLFAIPGSRRVDIIKIDENITIVNSFSTTKDIVCCFVYNGSLLIFVKTSQAIDGYYVVPIENIESYSLGIMNNFNLISITGNIAYWSVNFNSVSNGFVLGNSYGKSVLCKLNDGLIAGYDSETFVTSYNGKALGFAKTGGAAGETIEVYVPHES